MEAKVKYNIQQVPKQQQLKSLPTGKFFMLFCPLPIFSKSIFSKKFFGNTIRVSNSLDPDQA